MKTPPGRVARAKKVQHLMLQAKKSGEAFTFHSNMQKRPDWLFILRELDYAFDRQQLFSHLTCTLRKPRRSIKAIELNSLNI